MIEIFYFIVLLPIFTYRAIKIFLNQKIEKKLFQFNSVKYFNIYLILLPLPSLYNVITDSYDLSIRLSIYILGLLLLAVNIFLLRTPCYMSKSTLQTNSGVWRIEDIYDIRINDDILTFSVPKSLMALTDQVKVKINIEESETIKSFFNKANKKS